MEACYSLTPDSSVLLTMLWPIFFILLVLSHYIEAHLMATAASSQFQVNSSYNQTKEESDHRLQNTASDENNNTKRLEKMMVVGFQPRKCSNILDSHLDDIKVPALQPIPPQRRSVFAGSDVKKWKAGYIDLLDEGIEKLKTPVLEPERVGVVLPALLQHVPHVSNPKGLKKAIPVTRIRQESNTAKSPPRASATVPWDGKIRWAMKGCTVFEDDQEELNAYLYRPNVLSRLPVSDLWIFQYGLRYIPAVKETNVYRAVRIEKVPMDVTLNQILPHVPGEIYSSSLFDTAPITGCRTAIVTFVHERDALRFVWKSRNEVSLGPSVANVGLVPTPTYPMTAEMHRMIFHQGVSRTLAISGPRRSLKEEIHRVLKRSAYYSYVQSVEDGSIAGEIYIRFHSIKTAAAGHGLFQGHPSFGKCQVSFVRDSAE